MDTKDIILLSCDDGSGNIAFTYINDKGELVEGIRPSIVQKGDMLTLDGMNSVHAWADANTGEVYTAEIGATQPENTCDPLYQVSAANRTLVIDTLAHNAKLAGKKVILGCTLPAGAFYKNMRQNKELVEQKRKNLLTKMVNQDGALQSPDILSVSIYPEAIPAFFYVSTNEKGRLLPEYSDIERVIVVDVGQFTCDIAQLAISTENGTRNINLENMLSTENGIHVLHNNLRSKLTAKNIDRLQQPDRLTRAQLETLIERGYVGSSKVIEKRVDITGEIDAARRELSMTIRNDIRTMCRELATVDTLILVGGGAHLLKGIANSDDPHAAWHDSVEIPDRPEMAIVRGVHRMMQQNKDALIKAATAANDAKAEQVE